MVCDWARKKVVSFDVYVNVAPQPLRLFITGGACVCVCVCVCMCVCVCLYSSTVKASSVCKMSVTCLRGTDQRCYVVSIIRCASAKFLHLSIRKCHISPPKTKTPGSRELERKRYDTYVLREKMI